MHHPIGHHKVTRTRGHVKCIPLFLFCSGGNLPVIINTIFTQYLHVLPRVNSDPPWLSLKPGLTCWWLESAPHVFISQPKWVYDRVVRMWKQFANSLLYFLPLSLSCSKLAKSNNSYILAAISVSSFLGFCGEQRRWGFQTSLVHQRVFFQC